MEEKSVKLLIPQHYEKQWNNSEIGLDRFSWKFAIRWSNVTLVGVGQIAE